jgi:hypothetical protein
LVGELHQSQSKIQFTEAVHHIRWQCQWAKQSRPWWSVLGVLDVWDGETSGRRKIRRETGAAFGNDGELSRCNSGYSKGKSKRASCVLWSPFLVLRRKPRPRSPCTPAAEPFCGEAAEASDKPTFTASKPEKMLEVATETLTR